MSVTTDVVATLRSVRSPGRAALIRQWGRLLPWRSPRPWPWKVSPRRSAPSAYDALAESTIGLFKNEAVRDGSPCRLGSLRKLDDIERVIAAWVHWYDASRLHSTLGDVPPDEFVLRYPQPLTRTRA